MKTATEFIRNKFPNHDGIFVLRNIEEFMIEFAKMHVQEALKQASEEVKIETTTKNIVGTNIKVLQHDIDKSSILNAYPLENIK